MRFPWSHARGHHPSEPALAHDPVCGMQIDPASAAGSRMAGGRTFYLCSTACLEKFDRDPDAYAPRAPQPGTGMEAGERPHSHHHGCC